MGAAILLPRGCHYSPEKGGSRGKGAGQRGTTPTVRTSRNASTFSASPRRATVYVEAPRDGSIPDGVTHHGANLFGDSAHGFTRVIVRGGGPFG